MLGGILGVLVGIVSDADTVALCGVNPWPLATISCAARLTLLPLFLFFSPGAYAQLTRDPERDIKVSFWSSADKSTVLGEARNDSANLYPCVRLEFHLSTRFDLRQPGEEPRDLGVLPVYLKNLQPRETRPYQQRLPQPAGFGLKSVSQCAQPTGAPTTPEQPTGAPTTPEQPTGAPTTPEQPTGAPTTCSVTGRITGKLRWDGKDDRGQPVSYAVEFMYMRAPGVAEQRARVQQSGEYIFVNLTAGRIYTIFPGGRYSGLRFRSTPPERAVECRATINRGRDFEITGPPRSE